MEFSDELNEKLALGYLLFGDIHTACAFAARVDVNRFEATAMLRGGYPSESLRNTALVSLMWEIEDGIRDADPA